MKNETTVQWVVYGFDNNQLKWAKLCHANTKDEAMNRIRQYLIDKEVPKDMSQQWQLMSQLAQTQQVPVFTRFGIAKATTVTEFTECFEATLKLSTTIIEDN